MQARNPALGNSLVSDWNDRVVFWHRTTSLTQEQACPLKGVELVCHGLIPVAFGGAHAKLQILREGPIPEVATIDLPGEQNLAQQNGSLPSQDGAESHNPV